MSKTKLILACVTLAVLMVPVLAACAPAAPAKPAATTPPATTTPEKPATPPAATTPPAGTKLPALVIASKLSYEATTYTNKEYGFSFQYPSSMNAAAKPKAKYNIFEAADAMGIPTVSVGLYDTDKINDQVKETWDSVPATDFKSVSSENVTLADGKTKATFGQSTWTTAGYNFATYSVVVDLPGGKTVSVGYSSIIDMIDPVLAKEVVSTFTFK